MSTWFDQASWKKARADLRGPRRLLAVRPAGIEPAACGLKARCSLAPRREPLTTELRARAVDIRRLEPAEPTFYARPPAGRANAPPSSILWRPFHDRVAWQRAARHADAVAQADAGNVDGAEAEQLGNRHDPVAAGAQPGDDRGIGGQRLAPWAAPVMGDDDRARLHLGEHANRD